MLPARLAMVISAAPAPLELQTIVLHGRQVRPVTAPHPVILLHVLPEAARFN